MYIHIYTTVVNVMCIPKPNEFVPGCPQGGLPYTEATVLEFNGLADCGNRLRTFFFFSAKMMRTNVGSDTQQRRQRVKGACASIYLYTVHSYFFPTACTRILQKYTL